MDFTGKVVYITGGSSGIGLSCARAFASLGAHITIFARDISRLEDASRDIARHARSQGQLIHAVSMNVSDNEETASKTKEAMALTGPPHVAIANAGIGYAELFLNTPFSAFDAVMKTNVYGVRNFIAGVLPAMAYGGRIAIVSSLAGLIGMYGYTSYSTSKFALVGLAECLRAELKPMGISVTLVCPPEVDTPFLPQEAEHLPVESKVIKAFCGRISPERAARAVVKGVSRRRFLVIPGVLANVMYTIHRLSGGLLTRYASDALVWAVQRPARRGMKGRP
jgi:NAD(P)-dependent dehydrogenase (short-subunit alcohol dehydrogenase family)